MIFLPCGFSFVFLLTLLTVILSHGVLLVQSSKSYEIPEGYMALVRRLERKTDVRS